MKLSKDEIALLRSLVEWRRANGWTKGIVWRDSGRDADGAPWDDGYKIHVWSNSVSCIEVYLRPWMVEDGGPNLEQVLYQDIESDDTCVVWGARLVARLGLVRLVDSLSALGALPVEFSSAWAAGRESAYTTDGEIDFVTWDHREHPYCGDIDQLVSKLSGGRIRVTNVDDTGSDQHALAFGGRKLEQDEATEVYRAWLRRQWEDD